MCLFFLLKFKVIVENVLAFILGKRKRIHAWLSLPHYYFTISLYYIWRN